MADPGTNDRGEFLLARRNASIAIALLLAAYCGAFVLLYPAAITVSDEASYLRQAQLIVMGSRTVSQVDPFTGERVEFKPHDRYPLGTALLLVPFVGVGGWHAAFWLPMLCVALAVFVTARWLGEAGYSPLFAALILVYPPSIVMGRVAMSDAPSLLVVAAGTWLFFRGTQRNGATFLAAGVLAGFSVALREGNALLFAPLFLGSVLRRDPHVSRLVVGGVLGLGVRALSSWLYYGDAFFVKPPNPFSLASALESAPLYLVALLVLVPGGLVAGLAYRGSRRLEVVATVALFSGFHFLYSYSAAESGLAKRLILGPRYFIPLLPLLALCAAEVWPRFAKRIAARIAPARARLLATVVTGTLALALAATASAAVALQWAHSSWARDQARIRDAIYRETEEGSVIVTNWRTTGKFFDLVYGDRRVLRHEGLERDHVLQLMRQNESVYLVFLDRTDSAFGRKDAAENASFRSRLPGRLRLKLDLEITPTDRLNVWQMKR